MNVGARRIASEKPGSGRMSALSMYEVPPTEPISVSEFEDFAYDRLRRAPRPTAAVSPAQTASPMLAARSALTPAGPRV